jgi:MFS family permease
MTYLGLTVGPALGGWLAAQFGWRYVFYLNVPIGIIAIWLCFHVISIDLDTRTAERFDLAGAGLFLVSLSLFLLGLNQGYIWGWNSPIFLGVLTGAIFLMINFLWVEYRAQAAMLELSLFANRAFSQAVLSAIFNYIGVYSVIFLMPFYLLQGHGLSPDTAGLLLSAQPIIMTIIAPISGTLSDHIGTRLPTTFGMLGLTVGLYLLSSLNEYSTSGEIILALATVGLGTGTFISPNNSALMGSAPRNRQGIAAGILATARNLGMVLGVGLTGAIFTTLLSGPFIPGGESPLFVAIRYSFLMAGVFTIFGALTSAVHFPSQS